MPDYQNQTFIPDKKNNLFYVQCKRLESCHITSNLVILKVKSSIIKTINKLKNLVVLTGAGISAESGLKTFRDMGGLWEEYDVMEVASVDGWEKNPQLVLEFYNQRRKQMVQAKPNNGHIVLAELQKEFNVDIITQNVDDLHERAGSKNVLHLHGELKKARSSIDETDVFEIVGDGIKWGDKCKKGSQIRPHIVWFGEMVPAMTIANEIVSKADYFAVIGTSLNVYPAAGLLFIVNEDVPKFLIDPETVSVASGTNMHLIKENASTGVMKLRDVLLQD